MPGRRPTERGLRERLELAYLLLCSGKPKSAVKRAMREHFGPLHFTTLERYLSAARTKLLMDLGGREEWSLLGIYRCLNYRPSSTLPKGEPCPADAEPS